MSEPVTVKPMFSSTSAMPLMPAPPMPTMCTVLTRLYMAGLALRPGTAILVVSVIVMSSSSSSTSLGCLAAELFQPVHDARRGVRPGKILGRAAHGAEPRAVAQKPQHDVRQGRAA